METSAKKCSVCLLELPIDAFYFYYGKHTAACRACTIERASRRHYEKNLGISKDEALILISQAGSCESCGVSFAGTRRAVIDHDHVTGNIRGVLCDNCNTAFGLLGDSAEGVEKLLYYAKKFQ